MFSDDLLNGDLSAVGILYVFSYDEKLGKEQFLEFAEGSGVNLFQKGTGYIFGGAQITRVMFGCNKDSHTSIHTARDCLSQSDCAPGFTKVGFQVPKDADSRSAT